MDGNTGSIGVRLILLQIRGLSQHLPTPNTGGGRLLAAFLPESSTSRICLDVVAYLVLSVQF